MCPGVCLGKWKCVHEACKCVQEVEVCPGRTRPECRAPSPTESADGEMITCRTSNSEAGPPYHHDDRVDSDLNAELPPRLRARAQQLQVVEHATLRHPGVGFTSSFTGEFNGRGSTFTCENWGEGRFHEETNWERASKPYRVQGFHAEEFGVRDSGFRVQGLAGTARAPHFPKPSWFHQAP